MENIENESKKTILPNYDFLGLMGIQHEDILTLYGVVPRFWTESFSDNEIILDSKVHARILTQNKPTQLNQNEALRVQQKMSRIKEILPRDEEFINPDEDKQDKRLGEGVILPEKASELLEKLYYLCEFYHKKKENKITEMQEIASYGLPIFQFEEFVDLLEQRTRELRRTYRTVVEDVGAVRGRITTRGMMMMVARPSPMIECEYETFDIQAPLYKVMMSTLDVIRSTKLPRGFKFLEKKFEEICRRGANLRMKMAEIPSYPLSKAIRECVQLNRRLPRMFRPFEELLPIAEQILKRESHRLKMDNEELLTWHVTAPSSKLWELLLEESLKFSENRWDIEPQDELRGPWHVRHPKSIDLRIKDKESKKVVLVDAKYSVAPEIDSPPSSAYQYQQFFYAVKWGIENEYPPSAVALLYPASNEDEVNKNKRSEEEFEDDLKNRVGDVKFNVWTLPFPQPQDITDSDLQYYLKDLLNPKLTTLLGE